MKPSLAHWLVRHFTDAGDNVLDPLGGVGTVAFEASLLGRFAFTCDLSPFASTVARAKLAPPSSAQIMRELDAFADDLMNVELDAEDYADAEFGLNARVSEYYHEDTLSEVLKARRILAGHDLSPSRNFIKACLLHILHGNRPYALSRISHPITPFNPSGPFEYRSVMEKLRTRCHRLMGLDWPADFIPGTSWFSDFRELPRLLSEPVNAIICSPPFPGMRFDRPNWLRMWFCGWVAKDFQKTSLGFLERQQGKSLAVYDEFFKVCSEVTAIGAPVIIHVGGSKAYDMVEKLSAIGSRFLRHRSTIAENVAHIEKHGIKDKGSTTEHILLVFERVA
ncbi:SAM-dependent methyltransferase [Sinorhizobium meliloti]|uniref:SAM-dependent methyltransferase n=1 Tax=Rhizobium meliloti TaxID=382 RepID=UPI00186578E3|nr:SAM-dependent methyltransferase [Sinorhizobium meliloti]